MAHSEAGLREMAQVTRKHGVVAASLGMGPAGAYATSLDAKQQARLRERCREMLPAAPFVLSVRGVGSTGPRLAVIQAARRHRACARPFLASLHDSGSH